MRHRNVWAGGLALGLSLCVVGITLGQEPAGTEGNWFTNLFSHGRPHGFGRKDARKEERDLPAVAVVPTVATAPRTISRAQAQADYLRRLEVCLKLKEIAFQNGDSALQNKAEQLEQRASDVLTQQINRTGGGATSLDDATLQSHLATRTGTTSLLAGTRNDRGDGQASAEGRK